MKRLGEGWEKSETRKREKRREGDLVAMSRSRPGKARNTGRKRGVNSYERKEGLERGRRKKYTSPSSGRPLVTAEARQIRNF